MVMQLKIERHGTKSVIDLSLRGMYLQSFQFEGDNPLAQVQIVKSLHSEAIEMAFPCMEAPLFFQCFSSDHCRVPMERQHVYHIIHRSNYLCGCWVDVLNEIKFCRRNFEITCKFQIMNGEPSLSVMFLQCQRGVRVSLMFDMASVHGGCYPFDKKPADVQIQTYGLPASDIITCNDIVSRIRRIQYGFGRLSQICSCVEKIICN
ncbi:hypothetical protein L7F22_023977 [Adiantum nelumboides]|nr:hypothetical protein [Adiantum nelumboides]